MWFVFIFCFVASAINMIINGSSFYIIIVSLLAADAFTGLYHFLLDNFQWTRVPILEKQARLFQEHHSSPRDILSTSTLDIIKPAVPAAIIVLTLSLFMSGINVVFWFFFAVFSMSSQAIHRWSHMTITERPSIISTMMDVGLLITTKHHLKHHKEPFDINYSIINGWTNYATNYLYKRLVRYRNGS